MKNLISELNELRQHPEPDESIFEACAAIAREADDLAVQRGIQPARIPAMMTPKQAIALVNKIAIEIDSKNALLVPQAAEFMRVSQAKISEWIRQGRLQATNVAGEGKRPQYRITKEALMQLAPIKKYKPKHL